MWLICLPELSITHNKSSEEEEGVSPGLDPIKPSLRHPNLIFLNSAVTASCLQGSFCLPPCQPSPPLPHLPRNHGGGGVYDLSWRRRPGPPCPVPPSPAAFSSNLLSVCRSKIGQPFNISPSPSRQPPPSSAQPGSTRAASLPRRSALYTLQCAVDW